jgi:D-glycero-D-manno-heptose 1,7-bisphosphate phosphatase
MLPIIIRPFNKKYTSNIIYLDRDGVLLEPIIRGDKVSSARCQEEIKLCSDAIIFCRKLKSLGFTLVVVSNQPDLSRRLINLEFLRYTNEIISNSIDIDFYIYCPHQDYEQCSCRKPKPGMIKYFRTEYCPIPTREIMVGDRIVDFDCANSLKIDFILKQQPYTFLDNGKILLDYNFKYLNLNQALEELKI